MCVCVWCRFDVLEESTCEFVHLKENGKRRNDKSHINGDGQQNKFLNIIERMNKTTKIRGAIIKKWDNKMWYVTATQGVDTNIKQTSDYCIVECNQKENCPENQMRKKETLKKETEKKDIHWQTMSKLME